MIDIPNYEGIYQFDNELNQVFSIKKNKYLKNTLCKGLYYVGLYKNKIKKTYGINPISNICNPIENNNFVSILDYENYKFDTNLEQVYNLKTNMYLKNNLTDGYYTVGLSKNGKIKNFYIHKLVYIINNPTEDITGFQVDHIDNDRINNKIENLRKATRSENMSNKKVHKNNKLGVKNIHKNKNNTYTFNLMKNGIKYYKTFKILEEAIEYRNRFVLEKCGEFTRLD
tara:strand:+ start:1613 stop:2293 length:681 start_codon:yes stop_codon:yes gene_type:complete